MARPIDDIADALKSAIIQALQDREAELKSVTEAGGAKAGRGLVEDVTDMSGILDDVIGPILTAAEFFFPPLALLKQVAAAGGKIGSGFGMGYFLGYAAWQALSPALLPLQHSVGDFAQTEIFDPQTAAMLESKGIITNAAGRSEAAGGNLSGEHYDKLVDAARERPDIGMLLDALNRRLVDEPSVDNALARHGLPDFWHPIVKELRRQLLGPADLALAFLRSDIDEQTMLGYAEQLGVTVADMNVLVGNTGEPPGPEELMEALRRGFIDRARFERGIRQSRVRNEWVDVEYALRQSPMATAEAVRAVVENYLSDDQGRQIAEQNGLMPEHWRPLVESFGRPLSHEQMMQLFHRGQVTIEEVHQAFRESDLKDKYIDHAVELGRHLVPERTIVSMLDHGVVTHDRALEMLREQGFDDADARSLIALGSAQRVASHKTLTRADIVSMYEDSLLTQVQARDHLISLGYTKDDADAMLRLADVKVKAAADRQLQRSIEASLKAHHLTQQQAITQLEHAGLDSAQAQALVDRWLEQRGQVTRSLTEAQILQLAKHQLINPQNALDRLQGTGLAVADARLLLRLQGVEA